MGSSQRPGRDGLLTLQSEMRTEGIEVSIAKLCRWFGVARSTFYYTPEKAPSPPVIDAEICEQIRAVIEENPTHGVRMITAVVRRKCHGARNSPHSWASKSPHPPDPRGDQWNRLTT